MQAGNEYRKSLPVLRPALLPVDHPLAYPNLLLEPDVIAKTDKHVVNGTDEEEHQVEDCSLINLKTLEDKITYLFEHQQIVNILNQYAYNLDCCPIDGSIPHAWAALFSSDCQVTYPFGTHIGRDGLAEFAMKADLRFYRLFHLSSNITIKFSSSSVAYARSALFAVHSTDPQDLGQNFFEGGYYYLTLQKGECGWRIARLFLDASWWLGDSHGLNEPHDGFDSTVPL